MSHIQNDRARETLREFLEEYDVAEKDVMKDDNGAYILSIDEDGNKSKLYLPEGCAELL